MDETFKPNIPDKNRIENKVPEYSFNEGVAESVKRILDLYKKLDRDVFVVINGSAIQVGKTQLLGTLQGKFIEMGIETEPMIPFDYAQDPTIKKIIFYTSQGEYLSQSDAAKRGNISPKHPDFRMDSPYPADFYIGIYRPDREFKSFPKIKVAADIMIRNDYAKDRPYKL